MSFGISDETRGIDWSNASADYARFRPGPPPSFYARLAAFGTGLPGQRILDLGTGTGVLARNFAGQGSIVAGIDVAEGQLARARQLAAEQGLAIDFRHASAEATPFAAGAFDRLTANQCWSYFDKARAVPEVRRLLAPGGMLAVTQFSWLTHNDPIGRASEDLIYKHNPSFDTGRWSGEIRSMPDLAEGVRTCGLFWYDEAIPFTRETWRGRIRANRGVGASLSAHAVAAFDAEHDAMLRVMGAEDFTIPHRIEAAFYAFD
jgi:SAM-dependent methyltransferase